MTGIPERIATLIHRLEHDKQINPLFREDILTIVNSSTALAEASVDSTFPIENAFDNIAQIMSVCSRLLSNLERSRPQRYGFGIQHKTNGQMFPHLFATESEAEQFIINSRAFHDLGSVAQVVPIKMTSQFAQQPKIAPVPQVAAQPPVPQFNPEALSGIETPKQLTDNITEQIAAARIAMSPQVAATEDSSFDISIPTSEPLHE